jgi:hypothetical protein
MHVPIVFSFNVHASWQLLKKGILTKTKHRGSARPLWIGGGGGGGGGGGVSEFYQVVKANFAESQIFSDDIFLNLIDLVFNHRSSLHFPLIFHA